MARRILRPSQSGGVITPEYAVLISAETARKKAWLGVAKKLAARYNGSVLVSPGKLLDSEKLLIKKAPRYLAVVGEASEIDRVLVNFLHRVTRRFDDDPYGDCIWGIITGRNAAAAWKLAKECPPLIVKRAGGTTNVAPDRFKKCVCITDWTPFHVKETVKGGEAVDVKYDQIANDETAKLYVKNGTVLKFAKMLEKDHLQLLVTSSHATTYNLEMPFEKGLIVSGNGFFHVLNIADRPEYVSTLAREKQEGEKPILDLIDRKKYPRIRPDGETRIWLAAGNCLFGDAHNSANSMAVTALSSYGCRQLAGYTVPSWYGAAGWGALQMLTGNHDASDFAEACYFNNQFILERTLREYPRLMNVQFDEPEMGRNPINDQRFLQSVYQAGYPMGKDVIGLVHDRDVFAFYGDPKWSSRISEQYAPSPWHIEFDGNCVTVTANADASGRVAFFFPKRLKKVVDNAVLKTPEHAEGIPMKDAGVLTNDFFLVRELKLKKGESAVITPIEE